MLIELGTADRGAAGAVAECRNLAFQKSETTKEKIKIQGFAIDATFSTEKYDIICGI